MTDTLIDRLTGQPGAPTDLLPGQWEVRSEAPPKMNGAEARYLDRLTPARSCRAWRFGGSAGLIDPAVVPDDEVARAVFDVARPWLSGAMWGELVAASPVDPALASDAGLSGFEQRVIEKVVHLQQVCWDPRDQLKTVAELLPAHRVRRAAPDAERRLAAHSEDWANRSPIRVHPRRLRGLVPYEDLNLYENRVAARLRDRLDDHCAARVRSLRRRLAEIQALQDYTSDVKGGYRLRRRVATLWADATDGDDAHARVTALKTTIGELERLQRKLLRLRDSPLYQGVPRTARTSGPLEATNLFTEHEHYREVGALWRELDSLQQRDALDPQHHHDRWQRLCVAFDTFVRLLLVRVLGQFGYAPQSPEVALTDDGPPVPLSGRRGVITLRSHSDGSLVLQCPRGAMLRVIPLPASLDQEGTPPRVFPQLLVPPDRQALAQAVVYLSNGRGDATDTRQLPTQHIAVGVSPSALLSEERVAHLVGSWLAGTTFAAYPPTFEVSSVLRETIGAGPTGWVWTGPRSAALSQRPDKSEIDLLTVKLSTFAKGAVNKGEQNSRARAAKHLEEELVRARECISALHTCPVCMERAPTRDFLPRDGSCFECKCQSCGASWRLNASGDDRPAYPVLDTPDVRRLAGLNGVDVVREVGRDLLSVPTVRDGEVEWAHPWTG